MPTDPFHRFDEPIPAVAPDAAAEYVRRLVPSLGVDPYRYGPLLERHAFTLAIAADRVILDKVKSAILDQLKTGVNATPVVQDLLDAAGVSVRNPQFSEMVVRTNVMDALNAGATAELQAPEMQEAFPVWRYEAILDGRERATHGARNGKFYPSSVSFAEVRGTGIEEAANCRCTQTPIYRTEWADLQRQGVRVETVW